ncbi:hypothetical protein [Xylophilus ampelinus]|uniref:Uncharacterized protein n=1 Tax=Xylophilus ampelinus TaxID=54067 RepID=A0A318SQV4_9BURK|nr:hypothetical protein [Xylophilus ampelinus]MCS4509165.1 hypothetical protein [Xylophilus ampelinus]PYE79809.1 hypothetical protein DFQ15_101129 [Xylophilus ampelinus]
MRVDLRPHLDIDGPHLCRRRHRVATACLGYAVVFALLALAVVASMAQPLPF